MGPMQGGCLTIRFTVCIERSVTKVDFLVCLANVKKLYMPFIVPMDPIELVIIKKCKKNVYFL